MFNFEDRIDLIFKTAFFNFQFNFSRALALVLDLAWQPQPPSPKPQIILLSPLSEYKYQI